MNKDATYDKELYNLESRIAITRTLYNMLAEAVDLEEETMLYAAMHVILPEYDNVIVYIENEDDDDYIDSDPLNDEEKAVVSIIRGGIDFHHEQAGELERRLKEYLDRRNNRRGGN